MNQQKKQELFIELTSKYRHLEKYCKIKATGIDNEDIYFHIQFLINDKVFIHSQSDIKNSNGIYALRFIADGFSVDIDESLLTSIIIGYHTNENIVMLALNTLGNLRSHTEQLRNYTSEYVRNILIGNSVKETTSLFINELDATNKAIEFLQKFGNPESPKQNDI